MEASDRIQPSKSKRRQRGRRNNSGLKSNSSNITVSENVLTTIPKMDNKIQLRPSEIRYSQSSIACKFSDDTNIGTLLDDLILGRCFASAIPMIEVSMINNHWVSADNRRLWVFKQLEILSRIKTITVKVVKRIYQGKLTSNNAGLTVEIRGYPTGEAYNVLHAKNPDQYPLKADRNRRKRKAKGKKENNNGSAETRDAVSAAKVSTSVLKQADNYGNGSSSIRVNAMQNEAIIGYSDPSSMKVNDTMDEYTRDWNDSEIEYSDFEFSDDSEIDDEEYINYDYTSSNNSSDDVSDTENKPKGLVHDANTLSHDFLNLQLNQFENIYINTCLAKANGYETPKQIQKKSEDVSNVFKSPRNIQALNIHTRFHEPVLLSSSKAETKPRSTWSNSSLSSSRNNISGYGRAERLVTEKQRDTWRESYTSIQNRQSTTRESMQTHVFPNEVQRVNSSVRPRFVSDPLYPTGGDFDDSVKRSYVQPRYENCTSYSYHDDKPNKVLAYSSFEETPTHEYWCAISPPNVEHTPRRENVLVENGPGFLEAVLDGINKLGDFIKGIFTS